MNTKRKRNLKIFPNNYKGTNGKVITVTETFLWIEVLKSQFIIQIKLKKKDTNYLTKKKK